MARDVERSCNALGLLQAGVIEHLHLPARQPVVRKMEGGFPRGHVHAVERGDVIVKRAHDGGFDGRVDGTVFDAGGAGQRGE
jgi:hypothetical protein